MISKHYEAYARGVQCIKHVRVYVSGRGICGTQVKSYVRMKKTQQSSKWLFLGNLIPEIDSKGPN